MDTSLFGTKHILVLAICVVLIVGSLFLLSKKKVSLSTLSKILLLIGIISESIKVFYYIVANEDTLGGYLPKTDLPFHLCSIQILFFVALNLSKNEKFKRVLYSFMLPTCLIGGVAALLLPTSSAREVNIVTVQYFMYHSGIVVFAIYLLISKEIEFNIKDMVNCLICLFCALFIAIYLNGWLYDGNKNINFMYVVGPPMDNLPYLNKNNGWLSYIFRFIALAVVCVVCCYIKPIIKAIKGNKKTEK